MMIGSVERTPSTEVFPEKLVFCPKKGRGCGAAGHPFLIKYFVKINHQYTAAEAKFVYQIYPPACFFPIYYPFRMFRNLFSGHGSDYLLLHLNDGNIMHLEFFISQHQSL